MRVLLPFALLFISACGDNTLDDSYLDVDTEYFSLSKFDVRTVASCPELVSNIEIGEISDPHTNYFEKSSFVNGSASLHKLHDELAYFYVSYLNHNGTKSYKTFHGMEGDEFIVNIGSGSCHCTSTDYTVTNFESDKPVLLLNGELRNSPELIDAHTSMIRDVHSCPNDSVMELDSKRHAFVTPFDMPIELSTTKVNEITPIPGTIMRLKHGVIVGGSVSMTADYGLVNVSTPIYSNDPTNEVLELSYQQLSGGSVGETIPAYEVALDYLSVPNFSGSSNMGYGYFEYYAGDDIDFVVGDVSTTYSVDGENPVEWHFTIRKGSMSFNDLQYFPIGKEPYFAYDPSNLNDNFILMGITSTSIPVYSDIYTTKSARSTWLKVSGSAF